MNSKNLINVAAVAIFIPSLAHAYKVTLPKHSIVCGSLSSMKEAERAVAGKDQKWFDSLRDCLMTNQPLEAARVECESRFCKIRLWVPNGDSSLAYTFRSSMKTK